MLAAGFSLAGERHLPLPGPLSLLQIYAFRRI
jgi:hypothetical protein